MTILDWSIVAGYLVVMLVIGLAFARRASKSTSEFFLSGRSLPWWLAGTSMVATSFAADTPLVISGWVRTRGIAENWIWWCFLTGGMFSVFLLSRFWRRAEIVTDVELTELRYGGRSAAVLRGFKALYMAIPINCLTMAWVLVAMIKLSRVLFDLDPVMVELGGATFDAVPLVVIAVCAVITTAYCMMSGLWGVVMTDLIQFCLAMGGSIVLCVVVVQHCGGLGEIVERAGSASAAGEGTLRFVPPLPEEFAPWRLTFWQGPFVTFIVLLTVLWWSNKNADGGNVIIQRMAATKNERHSLLATLWFNVANYAVRPWPWILVALASLVVIPYARGEDQELAYPEMVRRYAPLVPGLMGVMVATFLAAFMSTIDTLMHLSASYAINDFYRRFVRREASERHYVLVSRLAAAGFMILSSLIALAADSISGLFTFLLAFSSGIGLVFIARWFWWRVNAWSEISAMIASGVVATTLHMLPAGAPPYSLLLLATVAVSTGVWVVVTLLTPPVPVDRLVAFYRKVRPYGLWGPVAAQAGVEPVRGLSRQVLNWIAATVMVFGMMFSLGKFLLCEPLAGGLWLVAAVAGGAVISREVLRRSADSQS